MCFQIHFCVRLLTAVATDSNSNSNINTNSTVLLRRLYNTTVVIAIVTFVDVRAWSDSYSSRQRAARQPQTHTHSRRSAAAGDVVVVVLGDTEI